VRSASSYHVGEIVAYRNGQLGGHVVLHRIIRIVDGHYYFKGDNNNFVDSYQPTRSGLVGRLWLRVPAAGRYLVLLRSHLFLAAGLGALLVLLLGAGVGGKKLRRRPRRPAPTFSFGALPIGAAALLALCGGLAALAYTRPLTTHALESGLYTQSGRFGYDAQAPAGASVYGSTTVTTGQPVFLRLVKTADFHFDYTFGSKAAHGVAGTIALDAKVTGSNGWKRTLHLTAPQHFSGDHASVSGAIALHSLSSLLERVDALSNVNGGTYTLTLLPNVQVSGIAGGNSVHDSFAPQLAFMLDPNQLQLQPGSVTGAGGASQLTQTTSGSGTVAVANSVQLLKFKLSVPSARRAAVVGGAAALLLLVIGLALGLRSRPVDEDEKIAREYADLIVPVEGVPVDSTAKVVHTSSLEGLARIAEQAGRMIMHAERSGVHTYFVEDTGVRYMFVRGSSPSTRGPLRLAREA